MTAVRMTTAAGDIAITRSDGLLASYTVPGQPERLVALKRRETTDLITEELRRMDDDDVYAHALLALQRYKDGASPGRTAAARPSAKKAASTRAVASETVSADQARQAAGKKAAPPGRLPRRRRPRPGRRANQAARKAAAKKSARRRKLPPASERRRRPPVRRVESMVSRAEILVHGSADDVAEALATRLMSRLVELQRDARTPQVALTGGRIATKAYQRIGLEGRSSAVDWSRVGLWWGDERFVAADDDDRNARQALTALSTLPLDLERVHPMPASGDGHDLDAAAEAYDTELGQTAFDICLLGMGPDGHVASLFPEHPSSYAEGGSSRCGPPPSLHRNGSR